MGLLGVAQGWGKKPPSLKSVTNILQWWKLAVIPYLEKIQKIYKSRDTPLEFCDISIFHRKSSNFAISRNRYILHFDTQFIILLTSFQSLRIVLINMVIILMISAKMATIDLLEIKVFWNKDYDITISVHGVANKILSRDSNHIVDLVVWPKFANSSISRREVTITSILEGFDQKNHFFLRGHLGSNLII